MRAFSLTALVLGACGAAIDLYSLSYSSGAEAATVLLVLGSVAGGAGVAAVVPRLAARTRAIGFAMEICGVAMALVSSWDPMVGALDSDLMLFIGGLMFLNGILMQRRPLVTP